MITKFHQVAILIRLLCHASYFGKARMYDFLKHEKNSWFILLHRYYLTCYKMLIFINIVLSLSSGCFKDHSLCLLQEVKSITSYQTNYFKRIILSFYISVHFHLRKKLNILFLYTSAVLKKLILWLKKSTYNFFTKTHRKNIKQF